MASKRNIHWSFYVIPTVVFALAIMMAYAPKEIDWSLSYSKKDKIPFGNSILFDQLPVLFGGDDDIVTSHSEFISFLGEVIPEATNYIVINKEYQPQNRELDKVLEVAEAGNSVFIAAQSLSVNLLDTFKLEINEPKLLQLKIMDSVSFNLANRKLKTPLGYWYKKAISNYYFTKYDSLKSTVLGFNNKGKTNFIRIQHGAGQVFINLNPLAFTNYNMLVQDNYGYIFKCLSYLPNQSTVWDEHYKPKPFEAVSKLNYIFKNKPLRYAWYLLLIGTALFFIFEFGRKQRKIPIVRPPENSTINFVQTIGRLYFSRRNHLDIAKKRYTYFLEFIRSRYYVNTTAEPGELHQQLSEKTGIPIRTIKQLFELGSSLHHINRLSEEDLEQFNKKIEYFYDNCR
ncbi:MAG: DUF4350 domain-containing protein [Marinilabiliaceae bacterium]|nr:DUF4350 domain-containing protein [Marinilabiliaceae bacterium]